MLEYRSMTRNQRWLYDRFKDRGGTLYLNRQQMNDAEVQAIAAALKVNKVATVILLSENLFGNAGVQAVADSLKVNMSVTTLCLRSNPIGDTGALAIAETLQLNTTLTFIRLGDCQIGDAGAQAIAKTLHVNTTLACLELSANQIGDAGMEAIALAFNVNKTVTSLRLGGNPIGDAAAQTIAETLAVNTTLTELGLGGANSNHLGDAGAQAIAEGLKANKAVTALDLSMNEIGTVGAQAIAEALKVNTTLTKLELSVNGIGDSGVKAIADGLKVNPRLTELHLAHCQIGAAGAKAISEALKVNKTVTQLYLGYNQIGDDGVQAIADTLKEHTMTELILSGNRIGDAGAQAIAEALRVNKRLTKLFLHENQIGYYEETALRQSAHASCTIPDSVRCTEVRVVLLGDPAVGKTSLVHGIAQHERNPVVKLFSGNKTIKTTSTDGIDISSVILRDKLPMILNIWDFAGQELYLASHQFFLGERTIYLALFDVRETISRNSRLAFWLRSLLSRVPNADIILVGTHIDDKSYSPQRHQEQLENLAELLLCFKQTHTSFNIRSTVYINASTAASASTMSELKAAVLEASRKMPSYYSEVDGRYLQFRDLLRDRANTMEADKKPPLLRWNEVVNLGMSQCKLSMQAVNVCMQLLRDQGWVVFHRLAPAADAVSGTNASEQTHANDHDLVIINPQWFTKTVLTGVITQKHTWVKKGILARADLLAHVWRNLDPAVCDQLLVLLQRYELLYPLADADAGTSGPRYLVPSFLPVGQPDRRAWSANPRKDEPHEATLVMRTAFLYTGFFSRVIARLNHLELNMTAWRDCVLVNRNHHRALVQIHRRTEEDVVDLVIVVRGASPGNLLETLFGVVEDLTTYWYTGMTWQTYLRCTECARDVQDACLFELEPTVLAAVIPTKELSCDHSQRTLDRGQWLAFIQPLLLRTLSSVAELTELQRQVLSAFGVSPAVAPSTVAPIAQPEPESHASSSSAIPVPAIATTILRVGMEELSQATGNFAPSRCIGGGGFGNVYSGTWSGAQVAVKRLAANSTQGISQFQAELDALTRYRHYNVVTIMCYAHEGNDCCLVYELMANGSVRDRLDRKGSTPALTWPQRQKIATEIASAMHFVQTAIPRQPLFHLDLKTDNVLLDAHFTAKVADFGLTRSAPAQTAAQSYIQTLTIQGTRQYICPQYRDEGKVSIKTDVYSYGMILLELLTGKQPGIELAGAVKRALKKQGQIDSELDASIVWGAPDKLAATAVAEIAVACLEPDRIDRPTFGQILKGFGQSGEDQGNALARAAMPQNARMEHHRALIKEQLQHHLDSGLVSSHMEPQSQLAEVSAAEVSRLSHRHSTIKEQLAPIADSIVVSTSEQSQLAAPELSPDIDRECLLCFSAPTTAKLIPCCHACVCVGCADLMIERQDKCMICRVIPTSYLQGIFNQTFVP
ncbi:TKL/IRAK protein kinase, variant 1 [Capsaspora owczarzaki ATCC 30864]|uniref:non-specific serine/threonine protein kinase n=2 Tax=Capsaspora owczarzaki (strain ATCC 30864) TaxID=595528 RepID=A0A0D2X3P8_CAPO3|nr:TKL/IRAK protein kinase, variant 1 [Capsaspora owczarzaki ATCC 30864]